MGEGLEKTLVALGPALLFPALGGDSGPGSPLPVFVSPDGTQE